MDKLNKLTIPTTILVSSLILGGFYYVAQTKKQEQQKKEYISKRRNECYSIYEKERAKFNNVVDVDYSMVRDVCVIKYKSEEPAKSEAECKKLLTDSKDSKAMADVIVNNYLDCMNNQFSKEY